MEKKVIDFEKDLKISKIKEDVNLILFNNFNFGINELKLSNEIFRRLENVKIEIFTY